MAVSCLTSSFCQVGGCLAEKDCFYFSFWIGGFSGLVVFPSWRINFLLFKVIVEGVVLWCTLFSILVSSLDSGSVVIAIFEAFWLSGICSWIFVV